MKTSNLKKLLVAAVLIGISTTLAHAEKPDAQAKLAKSLKIELSDVTIKEALEKIGQKARVKFVLSDQAIWKLPHGEATRLSVTLQGPLAESMKEMLNAFFMRYALGTEQVTIYPRPELDHILGKPTTEQLELLKAIYTNVMHEPGEDNTQVAINSILGHDVTIVPYKMYEAIEDIFNKGRLPMTVANMMEQILHKTDTRWYIKGSDFPNQLPEIRIVGIDEFRKAKLNQIVDISFNEPAETIIRRLANWTGTELHMDKLDPSWLQEPLSVEMQNITLRQALRNIVKIVDGKISFSVEFSRGRGRNNKVVLRDNNYVRIEQREQSSVNPPAKSKPVPRAAPKGRKPAGDEYVGKISVPMEGGKYFIEFMLRQSDLTDELKKLREQKITDILGTPPKPKPAPTPTAAPKKSD